MKTLLNIKGGFFKFILLVFLLAGFLIANIAQSYDSWNGHRGLTYEITEFYNFNYQDNKLSSEEIDWLMQGAQEEDTPPRWINHFYNPLTAEGWTADKLGEVSKGTLAWFSKWALSQRKPLSSKNWAKNRSAQADYARYADGDQTWQRAIEAYLEGDRYSAFIALGHTLHLIEDVTAPEHTRGDTHPALASDKGSPYESWVKQYVGSNIRGLDVAERAKANGYKPKEFLLLEDYFDFNANYSSQNFFSEDTIFAQDKNIPTVFKRIDSQGYTFIYTNINGDIYPIVKYPINKEDLTLFSVDDPQIMSAYWQRLSRQAVISGAGVINLFFQEVERQSKLPPKQRPKQNNSPHAQVFSLFGELAGLFRQSITLFTNFFPPVQTITAEENTTQNVASSSLYLDDTEEILSVIDLTEIPDVIEPPALSLTETPNLIEPSELNLSEQQNLYVSRVIDGDTVTLNNGQDVRLIGIDTAEYGDKCFEEAKRKLEDLILGKNIRLQKDISETDKYNRLLRYIYLDNFFINAEMIAQGFAKVMTIPPDTSYYQMFKNLYEEAKFFGRGCLHQKSALNEDGVGITQTIGYPVPNSENPYVGSGYATLDQPKTIGYPVPNSINSEETATNTSTLESELEIEEESNLEEQSDPEPPQEDENLEEETTQDPISNNELHIIINEIQLAGATSTKDEFIELYNPTDAVLDISGWKLAKKTASGNETNLVSSFADGVSISSLGYFLVAHQTDYSNSITPDGYYSGASYSVANNSTILLYDSEDNLIDKVGMGEADDFEAEATDNPDKSDSISRIDFIDSDNNKNDFAKTSSTPQNSVVEIESESEEESIEEDEEEDEEVEETEEEVEPFVCQEFSYGLHSKESGGGNSVNRKVATDVPIINSGAIVTLTADNNPYYSDDGIYVPPTSKLIIEEGVVIKFGRWRWGGWSYFPMRLRVDGDLEINGTMANPVILTTFRDDEHGMAIENTQSEPAPGDWGSIQIDSVNGKTVKINYAEFYYAGGSAGDGNMNGGAIFINGGADVDISNVKIMHSRSGVNSKPLIGSQPSIFDSEFSYNRLWGIIAKADSAINIIGNTFECNGLSLASGTTGGINIEGSPANVVIQNNIFRANQNMGLNYYTEAEEELEAKENYWGDASGPHNISSNPLGLGDTISDKVNFSPWLES